MIYICKVCGYEYDESKEATSFADLPDSWVCPVCGVGKDMFELLNFSNTPLNDLSITNFDFIDEVASITVQLPLNRYRSFTMLFQNPCQLDSCNTIQ